MAFTAKLSFWPQKRRMDDKYLLLVIISTIVFLILVIFIVVFSLLFQRKQSQNIKEKSAMKVAFEYEMYKSQAEVQNQTLQMVGRELHDNIGQLLTVAKIHLHVIEDLPQEQELSRIISEVRNLISSTIDEVRQLTKSLDGDFLKDFGLIASVRNELERIQSTGRYETELIIPQKIVAMGFDKEIILFRVIQEALNNSLKHASSNCVSVIIDIDDTFFRMIISDNGKGFDLDNLNIGTLGSSGAGLRNIKNRVELLQGTCNIQSKLGSGTQISIDIPI